MDRTSEFNSILNKNPNVHTSRTTAQAEDPDVSVRSGFNNEAARIGQDIHVAQLKLDELGKRMFSLTFCYLRRSSCAPKEHIQRFDFSNLSAY